MPPTSELPAYVSEVRFYRDVLASTLSAKRVAAQIIVSRQLLTQSMGTVALDQYLADKMRVAFASVLDQACLYGAGGSAPTGVVHVAGSQNVTTASPPVWDEVPHDQLRRKPRFVRRASCIRPDSIQPQAALKENGQRGL
jgi:Phage capsid family